MTKQRKATKRIYRGEDGRWRLETTYTTGRVCASVCNTKEAAERLLYLSDVYTKHFVEYNHNGKTITAKVTNTGVIENNDGTLKDMLYIRINNGTHLVPATKCQLVEVST